MPMYHWSKCEVLRNYASGDILVDAISAEDARSLARLDFEKFLRTRYSYEFYEGEPLDDDSAQNLQRYRDQLETDLSATPTVITRGAVFIEGSS